MDGERKISVYPGAGEGTKSPKPANGYTDIRGLYGFILLPLPAGNDIIKELLQYVSSTYKLVNWCSARRPPEKPQVTFVKWDSKEERASKKQVAFANA